LQNNFDHHGPNNNNNNRCCASIQETALRAKQLQDISNLNPENWWIRYRKLLDRRVHTTQKLLTFLRQLNSRNSEIYICEK